MTPRLAARPVGTRRAGSIAVALVLGLVAASPYACARPGANAASAQTRWVATWHAAQQLTEPRNLPPAPGLRGNTLRQFLRISIGGTRLRVRFSNTFGNGPLTLASARIAKAAGRGAIEPETERALMFRGEDSITIAPGQAIVSDPVDYNLAPLSELAISVHFRGSVPSDVTGHPGSRTTSYLAAGDHVGAVELPAAVRTEHWYVLSGIEIDAGGAEAAVAILGNSITDGRGSGTDRNNRWPDNLARRLQDDTRTAHIAVLNAGIGGNCVLRACLGPSALDRLDRDVLAQSGVRWLVLLEGVNDIGNARGAEASAVVARDLIAAYQQIIVRARARKLRVYGATVLPFGGSFYDTPDRESARQTVNEWIRSSGAFDAVIDFDAAMRDPSNPARLLPAADGGDHLHPNELGYRMMADAVDLVLFAK